MVWIFSPYSLLLEVASGLRYPCALIDLARDALSCVVIKKIIQCRNVRGPLI